MPFRREPDLVATGWPRFEQICRPISVSFVIRRGVYVVAHMSCNTVATHGHIYIYIYIWLLTKKPYSKKIIWVSFIIFFQRFRHGVKFFGFAGIRKIPEDFRKLVRKPTCFLQHHRSSGRFRKVSGSLSGSLLLFCLAFCNSGRFRKIPGSLSGSLFEHFDLLHSGSFRKVSGRPTGRSTKHQVLFLGL